MGEELIDPDTKESLGREEILIGKVKIIGVLPKTSTAEIIEDLGIDKEAVLKGAIIKTSCVAQFGYLVERLSFEKYREKLR